MCTYIYLAIPLWSLFCKCPTTGDSKKKQNILKYGSGVEEVEGEDDDTINYADDESSGMY